jgi:hypothetical protein
MKSEEDLEIGNTYIVEKIDLIGSQLCEVRIIQKLKLIMQIEVDGDIHKWIQYEEFDKNWKVIEIFKIKEQEFEILNRKSITVQYKNEMSNDISLALTISLVFAGSFIIFGIIIKTLFLNFK